MNRSLFTQNKNLFLILVFYGLSLAAYPQVSDLKDSLKQDKSGWRQNQHIISIGMGFANYDVTKFRGPAGTTSDYTLSSVQGSIPIHSKFDFYLRKHFGLGATLNYSSFNYNYTRNILYYNKISSETFAMTSYVITLNIRLNYHLFYNKIVDVYLGGGTGLRLVHSKSSSLGSPDFYSSGVFRDYELSAGVRYLALGTIGLYAEAGFGRSIVQAGISVDIKGF